MEKKEHGSWWIWIILIAIFYFLNSNSNTESSTQKVNNVESQATTLPTPVLVPTSTYKPTYNYSPDYFNGYECTDDCSGHEAGYDWVEDKDIQTYDDCGGNSNSFIEGCYSYVDENYGEESEEYYYDW